MLERKVISWLIDGFAVLLLVASIVRLSGEGHSWSAVWWVKEFGLHDAWLGLSLVEGLAGLLLLASPVLRVRAALSLAIAVAFLTTHIAGLAWFDSTACGCLGVDLIPTWVYLAGLVALVVVSARALGMRHEASRPSRRRRPWITAAFGVGFVSFTLVAILPSSADSSHVSSLKQRSAALGARYDGRPVWVVSGGCEHCRSAVRQASGQDLVLLVRDLDDETTSLRELADVTGAVLERIDGDLWWSLVRSKPPTKYRIENAQWVPVE